MRSRISIRGCCPSVGPSQTSWISEKRAEFERKWNQEHDNSETSTSQNAFNVWTVRLLSLLYVSHPFYPLSSIYLFLSATRVHVHPSSKPFRTKICAQIWQLIDIFGVIIAAVGLILLTKPSFILPSEKPAIANRLARLTSSSFILVCHKCH